MIDKTPPQMSSADWRAAVASENVKLGIKSMPKTMHREPLAQGGDEGGPSAYPARASGGRGRHEVGRMNKLETRYSQHLELRRMAGEIRRWAFEAVRLRLAERTFYNSDFIVVLTDGSIELHEVKGHWEDDARVKIKVAAKDFPEFQIVGVRRDKVDGWTFEYFKRGENL